jgi:hypothetical protein
VFTARYALSPYIKQICFVFKGLNVKNSFSHLLSCVTTSILKEGSDVIQRVSVDSSVRYVFCYEMEDRGSDSGLGINIPLQPPSKPAWGFAQNYSSGKPQPGHYHSLPHTAEVVNMWTFTYIATQFP